MYKSSLYITPLTDHEHYLQVSSSACDTYQFFNLSIVAKKGQWPGSLDSMLFQNLVWCACKAGNGEGTDKGHETRDRRREREGERVSFIT